MLFVSLLTVVSRRHHESTDFTVIADLFMHNAITGKRLLLLTLDSLHGMGLESVGHAVEIYVGS